MASAILMNSLFQCAAGVAYLLKKLLAKRDYPMLLTEAHLCDYLIGNTDDFSYYYKNLITINYSFQCAAGVAYETPCQKGLSYAPEAHLCDYPDNIYDCKGLSETVVGFKCPSPEELPPNAVARR